jgi:hypothetical protein
MDFNTAIPLTKEDVEAALKVDNECQTDFRELNTAKFEMPAFKLVVLDWIFQGSVRRTDYASGAIRSYLLDSDLSGFKMIKRSIYNRAGVFLALLVIFYVIFPLALFTLTAILLGH